MRRVEARERRGADGASARHDARGGRPDDGQRRGDLRPDDGGPVRLLVPREEIAREAEREDDEEQRDAHEPVQLARLAVRAEEERPREMERGKDDHRGRAPVVEAAHDGARGELRLDRPDALPRVVRRRRVREREREARDDLDDEREERGRAQREKPRPANRHGLVGEGAPERRRSRARLEELEEPLHASNAEESTVTRPPATTSGTFASGRGGGPARTRPSAP